MERLADELRRQEAQVSPAPTLCDGMQEDMYASLLAKAQAAARWGPSTADILVCLSLKAHLRDALQTHPV